MNKFIINEIKNELKFAADYFLKDEGWGYHRIHIFNKRHFAVDIGPITTEAIGSEPSSFGIGAFLEMVESIGTKFGVKIITNQRQNHYSNPDMDSDEEIYFV